MLGLSPCHQLTLVENIHGVSRSLSIWLLERVLIQLISCRSYRSSSIIQRRPQSPPIFRFDDLVYDIQVYIISFFICAPDLRSLTLVSRHIHSLAAPALYTDVKFLLGWKLSSGNSRVEGAFTKTLLRAQRAFKKQVLSQREHARHIRSLAWQFCSADRSCGHVFTDLFPFLDNLTTIHVVDPHPTDVCELNHNVEALFPNVKVVKLTGITCLSFAMPILHTPQHLTALSLDTIEPHSAHLSLLDWISKADLSNLRVLSLRALYQRDANRETEILLAWKDALSAVHLTLHEVTLGLRGQWTMGRTVFLPSTAGFAQFLLPIFWAENWPQLKKLRLEGFAIDKTGMDLTRLLPAVWEVDIDSTVQCVQRVWNPKSLQNF